LAGFQDETDRLTAHPADAPIRHRTPLGTVSVSWLIQSLNEEMRTMTRLTKSIVVDSPVEDVFEYLKDPARSWVDFTTKVHDIKRTPDGVGTTFRWESKVFGFHVTGTNEYTEIIPGERLVVTASKGFVFSFDLRSEGSGTKLTITEEDRPSNWVAAAFDAVAMKLTEHDIDTWLATVKANVEGAAAK
jgi:uncharacterized protein YndB with AHSA1/START domain